MRINGIEQADDSKSKKGSMAKNTPGGVTRKTDPILLSMIKYFKKIKKWTNIQLIRLLLFFQFLTF